MTMSFASTLFGSISRIFFHSSSQASSPSLKTTHAISETQSDPDLASPRAIKVFPRPASSASTRQRPSSAVEAGTYWSWEGQGGMVLRRRNGDGESSQDGLGGRGRKASFGSIFTVARRLIISRQNVAAHPHVCSVFAYQPPGAYYTPSQPSGFPSPGSYSISVDEPSFDISLISDTSTGSDEVDHDASLSFSFTLPDSNDMRDDVDPEPFFPSQGLGLGLGLAGLFKADGSVFDGMGVVGLGLAGDDDRETRGISRTFLEEIAWTWAADPHHRMLSVISEGSSEDEDLDIEIEYSDEDGDSVKEIAVAETSNGSSDGSVRVKTQLRDLSAMGTISSKLKRTTRPSPARSVTTPAPASDVRSDTPGLRRARAVLVYEQIGVLCRERSLEFLLED
ncbi:hypothetical protein C8F01DRAFT_1135329 [Mycena amicta]|nr:hypothetical protein C8F01DRAFT_1135329 [Mycena amicta]